MTALHVEELNWATGLASRLRLLQVSCADDSAEQQKQMIAQEVRRALVDIPKDRRRSYLDALSQKFPTFPVQTLTVQAQAGPSLAIATADEVLARLLETLPEMSEAERLKLVDRLRAANLVSVEQNRENGNDGKLSAELQKALGLDPEQHINLEKLSRFLALLVENVLLVDHFAWVKWTELAPQSGFKKPTWASGDLRALMRAYLCEGNDEETAQRWTQLREILGSQGGRTIKLLGEMLVALNRAGAKFSQAFLEQLSPDRIEDVIGNGGFLGIGNRNKQAYWDKYVELFRHYSTREAITQKIKESYVKAVEERLGNRHAPPG